MGSPGRGISHYQFVYAAVQRMPWGQVANYGLVAEQGVVFRPDGRLDLKRHRAESGPQALAS